MFVGKSLAWALAAVPLAFTLLTTPVGSQQVGDQSGCPSPPVSWTTNHTGQGKSFFRPYDTITYTCALGFMLRGPAIRMCQLDGTWTETDDACVIDSSSLILACIFGAMALVVSVTCYWWLVNRSRRERRRRRQRNRLTITGDRDPDAEPQAEPQAETETSVMTAGDAEQGLFNDAGPADDSEENSPAKDAQHPAADRSDSGHPTDNEMGGIDVDVFELEEDPWN